MPQIEKLTYCLHQEAPWSLGGTAVVLFFAVILVIVLLYYGINQWKSGEGPTIEFGVGKWYHTKIPIPVPIIVVVLILAVIPIFFWQAYEYFEHSHEVHLGFGAGATWTLEKIENDYDNKTDTKIKISENAKSFSVDKDVGGLCVADLFRSICHVYDDDLNCRHQFLERYVEIKMKQ